MNINKIAVFCASATGKNPIYAQQAYQLGRNIAKKGKGIVYGGAHVGLMGAVASGALENGGEVYGVIPEFLKTKELEYHGLTKTYVVDTMHQRKALMCELSDAIIALPGGFGTMEELFEMITWAQLALHKKPIALLNIDGFYDMLISFIDSMIEKGFVKKEYKDMIIVESDIDSLLTKIEAYKPTSNEKWFQPVNNGRL